ncbi:MAG: ribokinase [Ilumatobacteraceae bacterium]
MGSANLDLVATAPRLPGPGETVLGDEFAEYPGGKGLNQAVAAARAGATVAFVGAVGNDAAGDQLAQVMNTEEINTSLLARVPLVTGRALIGVSTAGENSIIVIPGANSAVRGEALVPARVLLVQLEVPVIEVLTALRTARAAGTITVLNPAPAQQLGSDVLALCDLVVPNEHEAEVLGGADRLLQLGAKAVVVTMGSAGARLHSAGGVVEFPAFAVQAIDTTAAGDAFCGALCARLAAGDRLERALNFAAAAGALAATRVGAVPSIPRRSEIEALLTSAV